MLVVADAVFHGSNHSVGLGPARSHVEGDRSVVVDPDMQLVLVVVVQGDHRFGLGEKPPTESMTLSARVHEQVEGSMTADREVRDRNAVDVHDLGVHVGTAFEPVAELLPHPDPVRCCHLTCDEFGGVRALEASVVNLLHRVDVIGSSLTRRDWIVHTPIVSQPL